MNAKVSKLINEQINKEFYSAYLYLDFANYYAAVGLDGFENWYRVQAQEERDHAMLFYQYLQNNGEDVTFEAIAKPEWERGDHMAPLKKALEHEMLITASIIPHRQVWIRANGSVPDDLRVHQYLLGYASDLNFLPVALQPHGIGSVSYTHLLQKMIVRKGELSFYDIFTLARAESTS